MRVAIVSNGDLGDPQYLRDKLPDFDTVICCDGGVRHLKTLGLKPGIIVGDFDSVDHSILDDYIAQGITVKKYPTDKDETDTQIAVEAAINLGADSIFLIGAIGSRWDHSYANVMLLVKLAELNIDACIIHNQNLIYVSDKVLKLTAQPGQIISLLPIGASVCVESTKGLKYPVNKRVLPLDFPFGISNVFTNDQAEIVISSGWLMAVIAND